MKKLFKKGQYIKGVFNGQSESGNDYRLKNLEKELSNIKTVLIGYLLGHFLGIILDGLLGR